MTTRVRRRALGAIGGAFLAGAHARVTGVALAAPLTAVAPSIAASIEETGVFFPETGHHLRSGFLDFWRRNRGPERLGLPLGEEQWDGGVGGTVQRFQRGRLEWRAGAPGAPGEVRQTGAPDGGGGASAPVARAAGAPDWTVALAPPAPVLGATPAPVRPGRALVVSVESDDPAGPLTVSGTIAPDGAAGREAPLRFFPAGPARHLGIAALSAVETPRPWVVTATVRNALGLESPTQSAVLQVVDGGFPLQRLAIQGDLVPLLDPDIGRRENLTLAAVMAESAPEPAWRGRFLQPVSGTLVTTHGARRTYVDPAGTAVASSQHAGVDLGAPFGVPILAPADGVVAFAGPWSIRGNVVILDHGAGVHSLHAHASAFVVATGQSVTRGQPIARIGSTGLSTGPHLHWEVRVGGVAVDPLEWTQRPDLALG